MRFQATVSERQVGGEIFCLPEAKAIQAARHDRSDCIQRIT
jgi:hypothetical protein